MRPFSKTLITIAALFTLAASPIWAQGLGYGQGGRGDGNPGAQMRMGMGGKRMGASMRFEIMNHLYPMQLVRKYAGEIELTDKQIEKLKKVVSATRSKVDELKWDLDKESRKLVKLIKENAEKSSVLKQMEQIFKLENTIKKSHLDLMLSIRDILTVKQHKELDKIKKTLPKRGLGKHAHKKAKRRNAKRQQQLAQHGNRSYLW